MSKFEIVFLYIHVFIESIACHILIIEPGNNSVIYAHQCTTERSTEADGGGGCIGEWWWAMVHPCAAPCPIRQQSQQTVSLYSFIVQTIADSLYSSKNMTCIQRCDCGIHRWSGTDIYCCAVDKFYSISLALYHDSVFIYSRTLWRYINTFCVSQRKKKSLCKKPRSDQTARPPNAVSIGYTIERYYSKMQSSDMCID